MIPPEIETKSDRPTFRPRLQEFSYRGSIDWLYAKPKHKPKSILRCLYEFTTDALHWLRVGMEPPSNPIQPYRIPWSMWMTLWILLCVGVIAFCVGMVS